MEVAGGEQVGGRGRHGGELQDWRLILGVVDTGDSGPESSKVIKW